MRLPTLFTLIDFIKEWNLAIRESKNAGDNPKFKTSPIGKLKKDCYAASERNIEGFAKAVHGYKPNEETRYETRHLIRPKIFGNQNECGPMCENLISAGLSAEENLMSDWVLRYKRERFINKEKPRVQIFANGRDITDQCSIADDYGMITVVYKGDGIL